MAIISLLNPGNKSTKRFYTGQFFTITITMFENKMKVSRFQRK